MRTLYNAPSSLIQSVFGLSYAHKCASQLFDLSSWTLKSLYRLTLPFLILPFLKGLLYRREKHSTRLYAME